MSRYLIQASYTSEGLNGLFDFAFGDHDVILIIDVPDRVSVAAIAMTVGAAGGASCKTTVLLSPEEIDRAAGVNAAYRRPGS